MYWSKVYVASGGMETVPYMQYAVCSRCKKYSIWHGGGMIYPDRSNVPFPNADLPEDIKEDYDEAAAIMSKSPRGAAALLRLCIQKLCVHLGGKGKKINSDIATLVKKGLSKKIQKSLDAVRVIGNEAVHPGQMDLKDDSKTTTKLFELVNIIADTMITQPKMIDDVYDSLPDTKLDEIKKRDS